jgi:cyclohexyl-isocyanide hydratase
MLEELAGRDYAEAVQLGLEYAPDPPFQSGRPELARPEILAQVKARMAAAADSRSDAALEASRRTEPA